MKSFTVASTLAFAIFTHAADVPVFGDDGTFTCPGTAAGKDFCGGNSLETNIIIRCNGNVGQPGNCNDNLAGVDPVGVKVDATCYQTSPTAGDAACSFDGIAYPDSGASFPIPGGEEPASTESEAPASATYYTSSSTSSAVAATLVTYPTETPTTKASPTPVYTYPISSETKSSATYVTLSSTMSSIYVIATHPGSSAGPGPKSSSSVTVATYPHVSPLPPPASYSTAGPGSSVSIATYPLASPPVATVAPGHPTASPVVPVPAPVYPTGKPGVPAPAPVPSVPGAAATASSTAGSGSGSGSGSGAGPAPKPSGNGTTIVAPSPVAPKPTATIVPGAASAGKSVGGLAVAAALAMFAYML